MTKTIKEKKFYFVECGDWRSKYYQLRIDANEVKRILDKGTCPCKKHKITYVLGY